MPSFLEGPLRNAVAAGFRGKLKKGMLRRDVFAAGVDEYGDPRPSSTVSYPFEGFVDTYSAFVRAQAGIPDTDAKVCILGANLPKGVVPRQGDRITLGGQRFQAVRLTNVDPAGALYEVQSTELQDG